MIRSKLCGLCLCDNCAGWWDQDPGLIDTLTLGWNRFMANQAGGNGGSGGGTPPTGPSAGNTGGAGGGGFRGRKVTNCSFCGKSSREVGPMVEGPNDIYICSNCTELCQNIFRQEKRKVSGSRPMFGQIPTPRQLKEFMDQYVIGQETAKRAMSVAVHNHYKRLAHADAGGGATAT